MDGLDRLGWAAGIAGRVHGRSIGLRVTDASVLERVRQRLPPTWKDAPLSVVDRLYSLVVGGPSEQDPRIRRFHLVYGDIIRVARDLDLDNVLDILESHLNRYVAETAPRHVFVHAGVVGWKGKAILIPGKTLSGKSTLVAALVRAGATYLSDEYAVLDARGRVHPYPKALSLRSAPTARPIRRTPQELGAVVGQKPLPVGLVISSKYQQGSRWRPKALTPGQGALELLANTIPARGRPHEVMSVLTQVMAGARALKGPRGEAEEMIPSLLETIAG